MSERDDLLPGAVGPIMVCGDTVESKMAFELTDQFFMGSPTAHKVPKP
jgi:hypothetical protein